MIPRDAVRIGRRRTAEGEGVKPDRNFVDSGLGGLVGDVDPQQIGYLALGCRRAWRPFQRRDIANP